MGGEAILRDAPASVDVHSAGRDAAHRDARGRPARPSARSSPSGSRWSRRSASRGNQPEWMMLDGHPGASRRTCARWCRSTAAGSRPRTSTTSTAASSTATTASSGCMELNAPEIIIRNEKRMLQEAVDALFDNGRRGKTITGPNKRPLKSPQRHAQGQAGPLPPEPARQARRLLGPLGHRRRARAAGCTSAACRRRWRSSCSSRSSTTSSKSAATSPPSRAPRRWWRRSGPRSGTSSRRSSSEHPVLLNRAPTLHRLGIQAFEPVLIEGKAIQLHPLVCAAFNADFDGDQMAVHVPLSHRGADGGARAHDEHQQHPVAGQRQADHRARPRTSSSACTT